MASRPPEEVSLAAAVICAAPVLADALERRLAEFAAAASSSPAIQAVIREESDPPCAP